MWFFSDVEAIEKRALKNSRSVLKCRHSHNVKLFFFLFLFFYVRKYCVRKWFFFVSQLIDIVTIIYLIGYDYIYNRFIENS